MKFFNPGHQRRLTHAARKFGVWARSLVFNFEQGTKCLRRRPYNDWTEHRIDPIHERYLALRSKCRAGELRLSKRVCRITAREMIEREAVGL